MEKQKKKKHVGLRIFGILIAVLILFAAGSYLYLSRDHFDVRARQLPLDAQTPYAGKTVLLENGLTQIPMEMQDVVWLLQQSNALDLSSTPVELESAAAQIHPDGITVDILAKAFGFLPLPIRVESEITPSDTALDVSLQKIMLGKQISIPVSKLARFGLQEHYQLNYDELVKGTDVRGMQLEENRLTMTVAFFDRMVQSTFGGSELAEVLMHYGADDDMLQTASGIYRAAPEEGMALYAQTLRKTDAEDLARLFALTSPEKAKQFLSELSAFDQRFLLDLAPEAVDAAAAQLQEEWIIPMNTRLTTLLDTLRETYKAGGIKVVTGDFAETETGASVTVSRLCPTDGFADENWHPVLLIGNDPRRAPMKADMPLFSQIPREGSATRIYEKLPYDIGWIGQLPDGTYAMIYYFSTGELCVHTLPSESGADIFESSRTALLYELDDAVFPQTRTIYDAPAAGLTQYAVFLPYDIDAVFAELS